jgi:hypothetical protein
MRRLFQEILFNEGFKLGGSSVNVMRNDRF